MFRLLTKTTTPEGWLKYTEPYSMTIKDVLSIPKGETVHIFFMDRNMYDISCDENPVGKPIKPSVFFKGGYYIKYTKTDEDGIKGDWSWYAYGEKMDDTYNNNWEFHIDLGHCWYPLKNDCVPEKDEQKLFKTGQKSGKCYRQFPENTLLGWRGAMMLVENMDKCPDIILRKKGCTD